MSERPANLDTLIYSLELLRRIPKHKKVTAVELNRQLEDMGLARGIRTVQRHLNMLCEHFDIERDDRNKPYGYRWKDRSEGLSLPILTEQESLVLSLAEQYLHNLLPANLMDSMQGFFDQAKYRLLPDGCSKPAHDWLEKVRVVSTTQPMLPPAVDSSIFEAVSNALYGDYWLDMVYLNQNGISSESLVQPLGLAQQGPRLYLICRYKGYIDNRALALHRMVKARATSMQFDRPDDFDLKTYDHEGRFGFGDGSLVQLSFTITQDRGFHITESPLSPDQKVIEAGDYLKISATVNDTDQLDWWLLGFGEDISDIRKEKIK